MKWTDTLDIAIELSEAHPDVDPTRINFVDLMNWVIALPGFDDDKSRCGEKILEAIQGAWKFPELTADRVGQHGAEFQLDTHGPLLARRLDQDFATIGKYEQ
jgi:FeS assembly protein IscX